MVLAPPLGGRADGAVPHHRDADGGGDEIRRKEGGGGVLLGGQKRTQAQALYLDLTVQLRYKPSI